MTPTKEQETIYNFVKYESNHGIIDAVAGSGKTTTIIESASFIEADNSILFCAFNKSIRDEIKRRFDDKGMSNITVKNLHQLGYDILKSNYEGKFNFEPTKYKKIISKLMEGDLKPYLKRYLILHKVKLVPENSYEESLIYNNTKIFKDKLEDICNKYRLTITQNNIDKFRELLFHYNIISVNRIDEKIIDKEVQLLFDANSEVLKVGNRLADEQRLIDFSDMLYLPYEFKLNPIGKYDILFVDECQDLSKSQIAVAFKYVKKNGRVLAVGDPNQSIYGFTGADINSFTNITKTLKNNISLTLSKCFRCPEIVIDMAKHFREDIEAFEPKFGLIEKIDFEDVIDKVKKGDLVISRTKAPLSILLFLLLEKNIEVSVHEDDVKDLINELRFLFSNEELNKRNIFRDDYGFFDKVFERNMYFAKKDAKKIKNTSEREEFLEEQEDFINRKIDFIKKQVSIRTNAPTLKEVISQIEKLITGSKNAVKLSTIHRAKGLENETVFILDYNKLPLKKDNQMDWELIQEKNLKYVALTRTKKNLYLVNAIKEEGDIERESLFDTLGDDLF
ncbi:UvrD-helicase domain-containing protein [Winogradskyella sp. MH6]|uniref:UvrD-helicase domain-containing protein n=1 Tax=Winogradskyella sp. MH6 TaxID=2929510 RepID=UPI001FB2D4B4|nr:UvrD-helicase domain-containing protein [Winogradskyella sp. MH6]